METKYNIKLHLYRIINEEYNKAECTGTELNIEKLSNKIYTEIIKPIQITSKPNASCSNCAFTEMCGHSPYGICEEYTVI